MTPYVWDFLVNKNNASLMRVFAVGASSIAAFIVSIIVYNIFFWKDFNSSGIDFIFSRSGYWSLGRLSELGISPWTQSVKIFIMNYMDFNGYGIPLAGFLIFVLIAIFLMKKIIAFTELKFIIFLFIGSISWLIIQPGHILFHPRYATLMFFLPFGLFIPGLMTNLLLREDRLKKYNV